MTYIVNDINYDTDAPRIRELIGEHRTVIIKNKVPLAPETLIEFYKKIGDVVRQNKKVTGTVATGELVKVRQNGLFAGKDDG